MKKTIEKQDQKEKDTINIKEEKVSKISLKKKVKLKKNISYGIAYNKSK
jgi:hypothetical protein